MPPKLDRLIDTLPALKPQAGRLARLARLQRVYGAAVAPWLAATSRVGWVDGTTLMLVADNGAAATTLRQRLPSLTSCLQAEDRALTGVKVTVQVSSRGVGAEPAPKRAKLTPAAARELARLAAALPPSPLRATVAEFAQRAASDQHQPLDDVEQRDRGE